MREWNERTEKKEGSDNQRNKRFGKRKQDAKYCREQRGQITRGTRGLLRGNKKLSIVGNRGVR